MSSRRSSPAWPIISTVVAVLVLVISMPQSWKAGWAPAWLSPSYHLGLDLAGGTQLDFRISENEIREQLNGINEEIATLEADGASPERTTQLRAEKLIVEEQQRNLVEAIRMVLERRINSLGVSEATITPSYVGDEKHLLIECPGVIDVQECIDTVGKTIQLEFKEEQTEASAEFEQSVQAKAQAALNRVTTSGTSLSVIGEDIGDDLGVSYVNDQIFFRDQIPAGLEGVWANPPSGVVLVEGSIKSPVQNAQGEVVEEDIPGLFLLEVTRPKAMTGRTVQDATQAFDILSGSGVTKYVEEDVALDAPLAGRMIAALSTMQPGALSIVSMDDGSADLIFLRERTPGRSEVDVSHILVAYQGSNSAPATVTRTKEEALARAESLKTQLEGGASFDELARTQSDGPSAQNAGKLGTVTRGQLATTMEDVAFTQAEGIISDPVETPFGYHLVRVDKAARTTKDSVSFDALTFATPNGSDKAEVAKARLENGLVTRSEEALPLRLLFFSLKPTGWKDTALDGKHFRSASVALDPTTNLPIVQIVFDQEGGRLFQELTKNNIGKSIAIFVGGDLVSAPTVQGEISGGTAIITGSGNIEEARLLAQDLNTGAIPAPIFLTGQRTVEASLGEESVRTSILAGFYGILIVMLYMLLVYRAFGLIANLALIAYAIIFLALLKLPLFLITDQYIVLTLAGAAGLILSIGMAVDTNVLVFERVKEELKKGKSLATAVEIGFEKAWPSVRDSNISTLITCALLFMIGTSIVRGFAVTLGIGVLISMFTGMIVSRWITRKLVATSLAKNPWLFPGSSSPSDSNA